MTSNGSGALTAGGATSVEHPPVEPVTPAERLAAVDTLRGFALFGVLLVNMALFSGPLYVLMMDRPWWTSPADRVAELLVRTFAEGKFYTLFSFLFGLGMAIQMQRVEARGVRFARLYVRRLLVLLAIGLCHGLLLWYGDILTVYALLGFVLLLFRRRAGKTILIWALVVYCLPLIAVSSWTAMAELGRLFPESAVQMHETFIRLERETVEWAQYSLQVYGSGSFGQIFRHRLDNQRDILWGTLFMLPVVLAMFLLGLYAGRRRLLHEPEAHLPLLRRLAVWGLPFGVLCNAGFAASFEWSSRVEPSWASLAGYILYLIGTTPLSFGYAAAIVLLVQRETWRRRLSPLAAVGRMALTNYLLQTLICTTLFYSYGLAWFGKVGPALGVLLTVAIYLAQIPFSVWWLRHFRFGPLEWLWRSLTYLRWQPMRLARPGGLPPPTQGLVA
jgi:uncharacterized protein